MKKALFLILLALTLSAAKYDKSLIDEQKVYVNYPLIAGAVKLPVYCIDGVKTLIIGYGRPDFSIVQLKINSLDGPAMAPCTPKDGL